MKRYSLIGLLALLLAVVVYGAVIEVPTAPARMTAIVVGGGNGTSGSAPAGAAFTDDFSTDPASRWTKLVGSNWTYDDVNDNVDMVADSTYLYNTQTNTVSQYACAQLTVSSYNGVAFRSDGNVANPYYIVRFNSGSSNPEWKYCTGASCTTIEVDTFTDNFVAGDYMCIEVTGTGASTTVGLWRFTSSPPARGSWGSASFTFSDDPATACNTGKYVGMYTEDNVTFDNFSGGDQ